MIQVTHGYALGKTRMVDAIWMDTARVNTNKVPFHRLLDPHSVVCLEELAACAGLLSLQR